jgi:hypothetical protein
MSFMDAPFPSNESGVLVAPLIRKLCPGVFNTMSRSKNGNVVVYEAILDPHNLSIVSLDQYWLHLDPSSRQKNLKHGHDRKAFNILDRYGFDLQVVAKVTSYHWKVRFARLANHTLDLHVSSRGVVSLYDPVAPNKRIEHMHVETYNMMGHPLPLVSHVSIFQRNTDGVRSIRNLTP